MVRERASRSPRRLVGVVWIVWAALLLLAWIWLSDGDPARPRGVDQGSVDKEKVSSGASKVATHREAAPLDPNDAGTSLTTDPAGAATLRIKGIVTDQFGRALCGCRVMTPGDVHREVPVGNAGEFEMSGFEPGELVELVVLAPADADSVWKGPLNAFVEAGDLDCRVVVDVVYEAWCSITVEVVDAATGQSISAKGVTIEPANPGAALIGRLPRVTQTPSGAQCDRVHAGAWRIQAEGEDGRWGREVVDVVAGDVRVVEVKVAQASKLKVRLEETRGERWHAQLVPERGHAVGDNASTPGFALLSKEGVVSMEGVAPGVPVSVRLESANWIGRVEVTVPAGETGRVVVRPERKAKVELVLDASTCRECRVEIRDEDSDWRQELVIHEPGAVQVTLPVGKFAWHMYYFERPKSGRVEPKTRSGRFEAKESEIVSVAL